MTDEQRDLLASPADSAAYTWAITGWRWPVSWLAFFLVGSGVRLSDHVAIVWLPSEAPPELRGSSLPRARIV